MHKKDNRRRNFENPNKYTISRIFNNYLDVKKKQAMTICNFVSMNSECYTTEYRPYLSPKGQVYLKVDNEGKLDLKPSIHHFSAGSLYIATQHIRSCLYLTYLMTHTYIYLCYAIFKRFDLIFKKNFTISLLCISAYALSLVCLLCRSLHCTKSFPNI